MSDTLNALQEANRSSSVLNAIANPAQVNPLSAMSAGVTAAGNVYKLRDMQAQQAWGQILQQSTDENGNVDYQKAQGLAAKNPIAAMGMMSALKDTSGLRGQQIVQAGGLDTLTSGLAASAIADSSDENLAAIRARGVAAGMPASALAEIDRIAALPKDQRKLEAWKHLSGQMGASYNLGVGGFPTPTVTQFGGTSAPVTIQPGTPYGPPTMTVGGGVAHTQDPATYYVPQESPILYDANGQVTTDPTKAVRKVDRVVPRGPAMGAPPPGSVGGPPSGGGPPAAAPPGALPPGAPPPPPGTRLQGGRFVAPAPAPNAAPPPAPSQPPAAGVVTGLLTGPEVDAATQHASDARAKSLGYQRDIQPIEGAITALSGADTGRASETLNNIRANIQDITPSFLQRMLPTSLTDPEARKAFEEANKYLTQMQLQAPGGARSDVGSATAGAATPSVHISNAAAREVALAVLAQRRLEQSGTLLFNQSGKPGAEFDRHMGAWNTQADPRAFIVDKMTPDERAAYVKGLGGTDTPAYKQYKKSYQDGVAAGVIPPPPAPQKQSFLAPPPGPVANPLQITG